VLLNVLVVMTSLDYDFALVWTTIQKMSTLEMPLNKLNCNVWNPCCILVACSRKRSLF
jgi:hypothetical protein